VLAPVALTWWRRIGIAAALRAIGAECRDELSALAAALKQRPALLVGIAIISAHLLVRVARALTMPRVGWDDFTYHLFHAGRWVQNGGMTLEPAPDAWSYYEFFPWGGDLIWAWALVWRAGDALVAVASVAIWVVCLLLGYGLARRCHQNPLPSLLAALALVILPSQLAEIGTAYIDNVQLMLMLACALLLLEVLQAPRSSSPMRAGAPVTAALLLGLGCGLGTIVKLSFLPFAAMVAVAVAWASVRQRRLQIVLALMAGTMVAMPNLAFNWYHRGSPFYPFRVFDLFPFNHQLAQVLGPPQPPDAAPPLLSAAVALIVNVKPERPFLNIGFTGMLLLLLGVAGAVRLWRRNPGERLYLICVVVSALATIGQLLSPSNSALYTNWSPVLGRLVIPCLAPVILLAGHFPRTLRLLFPLLLAEYFFDSPRSWPPQLVMATAIVLLALLTIGFAAVLHAHFRPRVGRSLVAVVVVASFMVIQTVHERMRYVSYRLFASGLLDDFHRASPVRAWPLWLRLDEAPPARIAIAAGWNGLGHNWFRYGFLGSRLQHDVRYVPLTADGSIVNYADHAKLLAVGDRQAWLTRLFDQEVDWVALLEPRTLEHQWVSELPDVFSIELSLDNGATILARVNEAALRSAVARRPSD